MKEKLNFMLELFNWYLFDNQMFCLKSGKNECHFLFFWWNCIPIVYVENSLCKYISLDLNLLLDFMGYCGSLLQWQLSVNISYQYPCPVLLSAYDESGLGHVNCDGQLNISKCETNRDWNIAFTSLQQCSETSCH